MKKRHVYLLAIALVLVLGAIILLLPGQTDRAPSDVNRAAVPGLEAAVNDLNRIVAVGAGDEVIATLERVEGGWTVLEFSGYGADIDVLREVLGGLAQARVLEAKTDNPAYYDRLGVEAMSGEDAAGVRLDLFSDGASWSVIIGNEAPARGGYYLRLADAPRSLLADYDGDVPDSAAGWVNTKVVDLLAAEVAEVTIRQPDGETLTAQKISADETDFTLLELPEGRALKSAWSVNSLGSALSTLDLEAVRRADEFDWDGAIAIRTLRFDGFEVNATLLRLGEAGDWLRLSANAPAPAADESDEIVAAMDVVLAEAEGLNARSSGWAFRIPAFKADAMDQRLDDLLREAAASEAGEPGAP